MWNHKNHTHGKITEFFKLPFFSNIKILLSFSVSSGKWWKFWWVFWEAFSSLPRPFKTQLPFPEKTNVSCFQIKFCHKWFSLKLFNFWFSICSQFNFLVSMTNVRISFHSSVTLLLRVVFMEILIYFVAGFSRLTKICILKNNDSFQPLHPHPIHQLTPRNIPIFNFPTFHPLSFFIIKFFMWELPINFGAHIKI